MPRKHIIRSSSHFYHLTARAMNKEFFFLTTNEMWEIITRKLSELQNKHDLKIPAFVLMSNHFHLLLLTPKEDIDRIMFYFMKDVTLIVQKRTGRINKIFGGRYKGCLIENEQYLMNAYKYIYRNPVEGYLADKAEDYQFSTLYYQSRSLKLPFQLETLEFVQSISKYSNSIHLDWINTKFEVAEATSIKGGLKKTVFAFQKDKKTNRPVVPD